jgi:NAD(P) transhydrogenase subunit alpha
MISRKWPSLVVLGLLLVAGVSGALAVDVAWPPAGSATDAPATGNETTRENENSDSSSGAHLAKLITCVTVFVLAIFVGFEVITKVPPTLHTPLMSGSNAISGITIVGALILAGDVNCPQIAKIMAFVAVIFATINVVGGYLVTDRMLRMFKRK